MRARSHARAAHAWIVVGALAAAAVGWALAGAAAGIVAGGVTAVLAGWPRARPRSGRTGPSGDAGDLAGSWELLAVCLRAGLPVATAVSAATEPLAGPVGDQLRRVAGLLALGADPATAWASTAEAARPGRVRPGRRPLGRHRRGSGPGGPAEAERLRAELLDSAQARAQRAAVLITGPLGLCFLPAFLVLGIAPVVIGLAREALAQW